MGSVERSQGGWDPAVGRHRTAFPCCHYPCSRNVILGELHLIEAKDGVTNFK